jgi:hypothetical protein
MCQHILQQYRQPLAPHKAAEKALLEKCGAEIYKETYGSHSAYDFVALPTLIHTPSLVAEYSKVRGAQLVPLAKTGHYFAFAVDNIGTITLSALAKNGPTLDRLPTAQKTNLEDLISTWKAHYLWKHERSASEERQKTDIVVNGRQTVLTEEVDVKKSAEKVMRESTQKDCTGRG